MEEKWKDIKGYEGLYQVSNLGRVKSLRRKVRTQKGSYYIKERELKICKDNIGYLVVGLTYKGKTKIIRLHRIIAEAFIPNPTNKPVINHINGIKNDNRIENLEWTTYKENSIHAIKTGLRQVTKKQREAGAKNVLKAIEGNCVKVKQFDLDGRYIKTWNSMAEIKKTLHVNYQGISDCCLGKGKTAYGYKWRYA